MEQRVDPLPADPRVAHLVALAADDHLAGRRAPAAMRVLLTRVDLAVDDVAVLERAAALRVRVLDRPAAAARWRRRHREIDRPVRGEARVATDADPATHADVVRRDVARAPE